MTTISLPEQIRRCIALLLSVVLLCGCGPGVGGTGTGTPVSYSGTGGTAGSPIEGGSGSTVPVLLLLTDVDTVYRAPCGQFEFRSDIANAGSDASLPGDLTIGSVHSNALLQLHFDPSTPDVVIVTLRDMAGIVILGPTSLQRASAAAAAC